MNFRQVEMAWFFPILGLFILLYIVRRVRRRSDLAKFSQAMASKQHISLNGLRLVLLCLSMLSLIVAMMRPTWGLQEKVLKKEGRDLVFVLDVSNSMRAEDVAPNRLERSKLAIAECVASLKSHRVGLVVFAGSASIKCPLTLDYEFFGKMLDEVDQSSVSHGGTRIEDALLKTCDKLFSDSKQGFKDIILISDGGDQGTQLEKAVNEIIELGIKMIVIGVGDEKNGARIPAIDIEGKMQDGFMLHEKREVWTKLESQFLRQLADLCQGAYLPAGTKQMDLARIYEQLSTQMPTQELSEHSVTVPIERYSLFLGLGLMLLIIMTLTPTSLKRVARSTAVLLICFFAIQLDAQEEDDFSAVALKQFSPEMEQVRESYLERLEREENSRKLTFDFATFLYENGDYISAIEWYHRTLESTTSSDGLCKLYYNLGNSYYRMASELDDLDEVLGHLMMSKTMYRKVLNEKSEHVSAAINLELTRRLIVERKREQEERDKREQELEAELEKIRQQLITHIEEQSHIQKLTQSKIEQFQIIASLSPQQKVLSDKTLDTIDLYEALRKNFFKDAPPEAFPFAESREFTRAAEKDESQASEDLLAQDHAVIKVQDSALDNLRKALAALDQDQNQSQSDESQESDSDSSEEGEEGEESDEESDEEGEDQSSADSAKMDLANQELPPPNQNPADIVKMEQQLQKMREANKKASKQKRVEKDW